MLSATAATRQAAVELLIRCADKVAAYERDQDVQLTPTITVAAYLRWWLDVDLVEQVEDGLITATTRLSYVNPIISHVIEPLGSVRLSDLSGARIREWQTWLRNNGRTANTRSKLKVLKTALQRAWKLELIATNPAKLVDPPKVKRARRE